MAGKIPRHFIDDLIARIDVVALVDQRVPLRKAGANYVACCPFHDEKTPSFTVSPTKQFYHCFGCGAHGNAIGFLLEFDRLEFVEAVESLAQQAGMEVPYEKGYKPAQKKQTDLYELLEQVYRFYRRQLAEHTTAHTAISYLKNRGLNSDICKRYGVGFAPPGWDNLLSHHKQSKSSLLTTGMLVNSSDNSRCYDRFRNRIMFPIRDRRGRVIGFGGRILGDEQPKYLNSPETPLFHKGKELYGLYEAQQVNQKLERVIIVEGYMDVIALAQFGVSNAVATLGTATTADHLQHLFRHCNEVVFCFDGDRAGKEAAWRALEVMLGQMQDGRLARFMFVPEGQDPDSLIRKEGLEGFNQRLSQALPLPDYFFHHLSGQVNMSSLDGKARLSQLALPLLNKLPNGAFLQMMLSRLGDLIRMSPDRLRLLMDDKTSTTTSTATPGNKQHTPSNMRLAIGLLLQHPELGQQLSADLNIEELTGPGSDLLVEVITRLRTTPTLTTGALIEHWRGSEHFAHINRLASWQHHVPADGLTAEFLGAIQHIQHHGRELRINALMQRANGEGLSDHEKSTLQGLIMQSKAGIKTPGTV